MSPSIDPSQVVYKRKPVRIEAPPCEYDDDTMVSKGCLHPPNLVPPLTYHHLVPQVWQITETGEVYNTYDGYLDR